MFLKNKKKSRLKILLRILLSVFILGLFFGSFYLIVYSDFLNVKIFDFEYSNNQQEKSIFYTNDFLISSLSKQIIKEEKNLGYLGSDSVLFWLLGKKENLVNNNILPSVEEISLKVDLFDLKVTFSVNEKELTGIICKLKNSCFAFDKSGRIFTEAPFVKGSLIFKIDDLNERPLVPGEKFLPKDKWINNIFETVEIIKRNGFQIKSATIRKMDLVEWIVVVSEGPKLLFSLDFIPSDLDEIMKTLKERADFSTVKYFDMRVENKIYYK